MKRILPLLIILVILCSCAEQDVGPRYAHVSASTETKVLIATDLSAYDRWEFKAEPKFEDPDVYGAVTSWRALDISDNMADLGYYTPGLWLFSVRAFNSQNRLIAEGNSGEVYLSADQDNSVTILLHNSLGEGLGTVYLNVAIQTLPGISLSVSYSTVTIEDEVVTIGEPVDATSRFTRGAKSGTTTWQGYVRDLPSGTYVFYVSVEDSEGTVAGQALEVKVLPGIRTDIEGTLTPGSFVQGNMQIVTYGVIDGKIVSPDYDEELDVVIIPETDIRTTLSWETQVGTEPSSYRWYVDGKRQVGATSKTFTFTPAAGFGDYVVSCIAIGRVSGESTSAGILVRYLP
jgi:hypothetical protein